MVERNPNKVSETNRDLRALPQPWRANGVGRLTSVIDASGQSFFDYDYAGRVTTTSTRVNIGGQLTDPYTLNRTYDALGRISTITYPAPDNETIQYGYDNNGNLDSVTRVGGACYAAFSAYNAAGQPGNIQFYNGASTLLEYYPSNNRLRSVVTNANDLVQAIHYTAYDKNGNVKSIEDGSEAVKTFAYGYDGLNRLRTADSSAYGGLENIGLDYAGVGNIWKNSITGTDTFPAERELVYDYDNRLAAINTDSGMTTFVYNYQGERVVKQSGNSTTIYIGGLFEDKDGVKVKHIFAGDRRIVTRIGSSTYYYHPDHLGGLSVITNSGGDVAQKAAYYPFGQQIDPGVETDPLPYRFTGQELDTETGLYYYKSRYYDPMIGRFISPDALSQAAFDPPSFPRLIGFDYGVKAAPIYASGEGDLDLARVIGSYVYVKNNPLNATDATGLFEEWWEKGYLGTKVHTAFFRWVSSRFPGDYRFDRSLSSSGLGMSMLRPDVIEKFEGGGGRVWELKPISHMGPYSIYKGSDQLQLQGYMQTMLASGYEKGDPNIFLSSGPELMPEFVYGRFGDEYLVCLYPGSRDSGFIYYQESPTGRNYFWDQFERAPSKYQDFYPTLPLQMFQLLF
ncbi:MAG: RHS repeat domain-containing protein [Syntrophobacteraceae bacterium]